MNKKSYPKLLLVLLIIALTTLLAACGASPTEEAKEEPTPTEEPAATEEAMEEETSTEAIAEKEEAQQASSNEEGSEVIDKENVLASDNVFGMIVETDEPDVSAPRAKRGGEYRSVQTSDAVSFHPYITVDTGSSGYQGLVYSGGFVGIDENTLEYEPAAAERYEISDDGLTFTFYLRQDMKWSDGQPITAQDYKWTFDQMMDPVNEYPYFSQMEFITSYEMLDDYTIQATIDEIYAPALLNVGQAVTPLPKHIWENLPWDDPEANPEINHPSVVSGPYKLKEWERDQYIIFEANESYWYYGAPNIETYIIETVPDIDIAFQKFKSGETDGAAMTPEQIEEAKTFEHATVYEWWPAQTVWFYLGMNMRQGYLTADLNIRRAIAYAIDKELLIEEVWLGQSKRLCAIYAPTSWAHNPDVPCYEYDPDMALEEFAKAGYTLEGDKLVNEEGEQLTIRFLYGPNTSKTAELVAVTIQDNLKGVGINMEIEALEWSSFLEATDAEEPTWDMYFGAWRSGIEPHSASTVWAEENIPNLNSVAYINAEMTEYFEQAGATYNRELRQEAYSQVQDIIATDLPYITLGYRKSLSGKNNRVKGIEPTALGIGWNQEEWYIEE